MRKLLLGAAAISLSGCSFLGLGGHGAHQGYNAPSYGTGYASTGSKCSPSHAVLANGNCLSRLNIEGGVGASFHVGGDVVTGDKGTFPGTNVRNVSYEEAYDTGIRYELGASYALSPNTKVSATGFIDEADSAGNLNFGTVGGAAFTGSMSDRKSTGLELGLRKYFNPKSAPLVRSVRPYVEGRVGAAYQDAVFMENAQLGGVNIGTGRLAFSDSGWVPSAAGLVGIETPLTRYSTIGIETGLRYTGAPETNNTTFGPGPFQDLNDSEAHLSVPLMLRGRYRF
ncbi:hypothetical protein [Algimonas arctica]|nr:hypothetical protein [Algimonas arctica]